MKEFLEYFESTAGEDVTVDYENAYEFSYTAPTPKWNDFIDAVEEEVGSIDDFQNIVYVCEFSPVGKGETTKADCDEKP